MLGRRESDCRAGREARLTWRSRGTHLPPRVPLPPVAGRWQLRCEQHPGCWRQQAPWQLKTQRVGLGQRSLSPGAHIPLTSAQGHPATSSLQLAGSREGAFCLSSPRSLSFSALPPWGTHGLGAVRTRRGRLLPWPSRVGAHHPGCGRCRTHPERLEQEGRAKGSG